MSSFVHILEVCTLLLFCALFYQVYRCYQNYLAGIKAKATSINTSRSSLSIQVNIPSHLPNTFSSRVASTPIDLSSSGSLDSSSGSYSSDNYIVVEEPVESNDKRVEPGQSTQASNGNVCDVLETAVEEPTPSVNDQILNDYIGEFFTTEPSGIDIAQYRNVAESPVVESPVVESPVVESTAESSVAERHVTESVDNGQTADMLQTSSHTEKLELIDDPETKASIDELSESLARLEQKELGKLEPVDDDLSLFVMNDEQDEVITVEQNVINTSFVDAAMAASNESNQNIPTLTELTNSELTTTELSNSGLTNSELTTISSDNDDESIIVVDSKDKNSSAEHDNVMSDKVVHAMLDEAKLICAS